MCQRTSRITFPRRVVVDRSFQFRSVDTMLINEVHMMRACKKCLLRTGFISAVNGSFYILADTFLYLFSWERSIPRAAPLNQTPPQAKTGEVKEHDKHKHLTE